MSNSTGRNKDGPALSRRAFLKGSGVAAAATALTASPLPALAPSRLSEGDKVAGMGPGPVRIQLTINGKKMSHAVEPRTTLLDSMRNHLDVTGCKRVCDRGTCGACTVMLDGKPIYSCTMFAVEAQDHEIKTAEALVAEGKLDTVPASFVQYDAQQCGFCTPGFIVALRAALDKNPSASPAEIEEALCGNICRCGTYQQMREAVVALSKGAGKEG
jgi:xanthine dehydrogenase YagT iron-sulfur-binding subunit